VALRAERSSLSRQRGPALPEALIELAAGRAPGIIELDANLVAVAREHRMAGLLWTAIKEQEACDPALKAQLAMSDLYIQGHLVRVSSVLEDAVARLEAIGIEVATIKGVTAEARWYARRGERPCSDVDLLLAPHQLDRAVEVVAALQPDHPWLPHMKEMVTSARVQSITMRLNGLEVDLHFDLLKLGIPTRQSAELWGRTLSYSLPGGGSVRVVDDTAAMFHLLLHLNKDRFQRLLGYADIPRLMASDQVDWRDLLRLAEHEGIEVPVLQTLDVVLDLLKVPWPEEISRPHGPRSWTWSLLWRPSIRLRGREGRLRFRKRQDWIAVLARGRSREAIIWWLRGLLPPSPTVHAHYAHIRGPYPWKLARGRAQAAVAHIRALARLRR
jgi:hypothetical protein